MTEPTQRPRTKCCRCGGSHRGKHDICVACRTRSKQEYAEHEVALTGGRWVRRGAIRVWDGPRPIETPDRADLLVDTLARNLKDSKAQIIHEKPEPAFCVCGCWLLSEAEDCPACMVRVEWLTWAVKAEALHNARNFSLEMGRVA